MEEVDDTLIMFKPRPSTTLFVLCRMCESAPKNEPFLDEITPKISCPTDNFKILLARQENCLIVVTKCIWLLDVFLLTF